jgi:hypothetical protein
MNDWERCCSRGMALGRRLRSGSRSTNRTSPKSLDEEAQYSGSHITIVVGAVGHFNQGRHLGI